ncbi:hypothetical protein [Streptomyces sp. NPDC000229]|uniref:hypothetical protein n=1 Tax=Streptomyces sp. NPDC000229 TaxID=3154247 RepID=UPI00332DCFC9
MQVVRPQAEDVFADEGPFDQPQGRCFVRQSGGRGGQVQVEGVQQGHGAQDVPLVEGEVGQGAGDQRGEVVVKVGRLRRSAGAADLQEAHDRQIEVERQAVGAVGDAPSDLLVDERFAVAGESAGEVVVTVLGREREVADETCRGACYGIGTGAISLITFWIQHGQW